MGAFQEPRLARGHTPGRGQSCVGASRRRSLTCSAFLHFWAVSPLSLWRGFPSPLWGAGCTLGHGRGGADSVPLPDGQGQPWRSVELAVGLGCPVTCPGRRGHLYLQVAPERQGEPAGGNPRVSSSFLPGTHSDPFPPAGAPEPRQPPRPPEVHPPDSRSGGGTPDSSSGQECFCGSRDRCRLPGCMLRQEWVSGHCDKGRGQEEGRAFLNSKADLGPLGEGQK